jgi:hypothetical protein
MISVCGNLRGSVISVHPPKKKICRIQIDLDFSDSLSPSQVTHLLVTALRRPVRFGASSRPSCQCISILLGMFNSRVLRFLVGLIVDEQSLVSMCLIEGLACRTRHHQSRRRGIYQWCGSSLVWAWLGVDLGPGEGRRLPGRRWRWQRCGASRRYCA